MLAIGIWFAVAGGVAVLAGVTSRRRAGRLRQRGVAAWATVISAPRRSDDDLPGAATMIRYPLQDGRVTEQRCPAAVRKASALLPGQKVQVWYDQADPGEVLVSGRDGRYSDRAFAIAGMLLVLGGVWIAGH